jgi:putative sigma-54 modulation protein
MKISITGRHFDVTDHLKNHAEKRANKFKHYFDKITEMDVTMEKEHTLYKVSATFDVDKKTFHIETKDYDVYDSVDKLMEKIERRIRRHREKITSHHKRIPLSQVASEIEGEL